MSYSINRVFSFCFNFNVSGFMVLNSKTNFINKKIIINIKNKQKFLSKVLTIIFYVNNFLVKITENKYATLKLTFINPLILKKKYLIIIL